MGNSPVDFFISANANRSVRVGAERLTVESATSHFELLEVRQSTPFRRNSTSEHVRPRTTVFAVATRQMKNLERNWEHLWQRPCANSINFSREQTALSAGAECVGNAPDNEFSDTMSRSKLASLQNSLGRKPAKTCFGHSTESRGRTVHTVRTCQQISCHVEVRQIA